MSSVLVEDLGRYLPVHRVNALDHLSSLRNWPYIWTLSVRAEDKSEFTRQVHSLAIFREENGHPVVFFIFGPTFFAPWRCCTLRLQLYSALLRLSTRAVVAVVANPVHKLGIGDTSRRCSASPPSPHPSDFIENGSQNSDFIENGSRNSDFIENGSQNSDFIENGSRNSDFIENGSQNSDFIEDGSLYDGAAAARELRVLLVPAVFGDTCR
jgi:hypothetical protein